MNYEDTVMKNLGEKYSGEYLADSIIEDIEAQAEANIEPHRKKKAWVDCPACGVPRLVTVDPQGVPYGSGLCKGCAQRRRYEHKVILV